MEYPLRLSFRTLALVPRFSVTDAGGRLLFHVRQKAFKLKESVAVFADADRTRQVAEIAADRVLDISATYRFREPGGAPFGAVRRRGLRSLWKASYEVLHGEDDIRMTIREENGWIKLLDGITAQIPVLNLFTGYVFHPAYRVSRPDGSDVLRVRKEPAFFEGRFSIERLGELDEAEEALAILSILMMVLLERRRG